jgi:protein SCO1
VSGRQIAGVAALLVSVLAVAACGASSKQPTHVVDALIGQPTLIRGVAADFRLRDQDGHRVTLAGERGRVVLLTFLYTSCPDICPITAAALGTAVRELGSAAQRVRVLAVSVDPDNDTRANVRRFIARLKLPPEFRYLSGTRAQLQPVWQSYNVLVERRNLERVDHGIPIVAIDKRGRPRVYFSHTATPAAIAHDVRLLLRQRT